MEHYEEVNIIKPEFIALGNISYHIKSFWKTAVW